MALTVGSRLGHYAVTDKIGEGGMGEVYRARDTKLDRDVALKVLSHAFTNDPDRLARFAREAKVLAALSHPNVGQIYGLEEAEGQRALVLELIEGPTLADRIKQGPIPLDEALPIARQIAEALEAAHEAGVIHRDLKPANIKVTNDGTVKVLDFGLAKAVDPSSSVDPTQSPTVTAAVTQQGVILGTAAYMSPEQARGKPVDKRADIWAIGCVLYEMLAGRPAFEGDTVPDILSRVARAEPDWTRLPPGVPPAIRRLLRLCLDVSPKRRRQSAGDVRIDLEESLTVPEVVAPTPSTRPAPWRRLAWIGGASVPAVLLALLAVVHFREAPPPERRLQIVTPPTVNPDIAVSPDGRYVVFTASGPSAEGPERLHLRALDETQARPLDGTEGARFPFWSTDSRSIGFFAGERLFRIAAAGGPVRELGPAAFPLGGSWNADGSILYAPDSTRPLVRVSDSGGTPVNATQFDSSRQTNHRWPTFLPDGRRFLFYATGEEEASGLYLGSLDGGVATRLGPADDGPAVYLEPDRVVFAQQGALVARRLDLSRSELVGDTLTLVASEGTARLGRVGLSASTTGILTYRAATDEAGAWQTTWFDRAGNVLKGGEFLNGPELSPDGRYLAGDRVVDNNRDVWVLDIVRGDLIRRTTHPAVDSYPLWSPDSRQIVFDSRRNGTFDLWIKSASGADDERLLWESPSQEIPIDWSLDGRFLLYRRDDDSFAASDLLALPMDGDDRTPVVVANTPSEERMGAFSPDGRWIAYDTNESGRFEVRVQAFPEPSGWWPVSTDGGVAPRWTIEGEINFIAPDGTMMAVRVAADGSSLEAERPVPLFQTRRRPNPFKQVYAVSADGQFLVNTVMADDRSSPITVLLNWRP